MSNSGKGASQAKPNDPTGTAGNPTSYSGGDAPIKVQGASPDATDYGMNPSSKGK